MDIITADAATLALLAGVLAAFNPCGFALLPAYITVIVTGSFGEQVSRPEAITRATRFGLAMTVGFVAVFSVFALFFSGANAAFQGNILPYIPYFTTAIGLALVVLGVYMFSGGEFSIPGFKVSNAAPAKSFASQVGYGAAFAIASLSCTIAPFIAVVNGALNATNPVGAGLPFIIYAIGMGTSVIAISLLAAVFGSTALAGFRSKMGTIIKVVAVVMIVAGLYVATYGLAEILQKSNVEWANDFILANGDIQGSVTRAIQDAGITPLIVVVSLVAVAAISVAVWARVERGKSNGAPAAGGSASPSGPASGVAAAGIKLDGKAPVAAKPTTAMTTTAKPAAKKTASTEPAAKKPTTKRKPPATK